MKTTDQIIHEARELCWHEWDTNRDNLGTSLVPKCKKCRADSKWFSNLSYTKWEHYGPMLEWAMKEPWWDEFAYNKSAQGCFREDILNPLRGSTAIAEFLKERKS